MFPHGVSHALQSDRLERMSVLLHVLGLSYEAVEDLPESIITDIGKRTVCENVQEARAHRVSDRAMM